MSAVTSTLAVVLTWLVLGAILLGCGFAVRRALERPAGGLAPADLWIGLGALTAYLQLWSLGLRIGWAAWLPPAATGILGLALALRGLRLARPRPLPLVLAALGVLWLANRALAVAADYDLGLYHLNAIGYALHYPAIPGLANLQPRLGAGNAHLVFVAFLRHGPWGGAAPHLASGLLVSMLFVDIAWRFASAGTGPSFTRRLTLLLVPATIAIAGTSPTYRLSSPNLDLAAFVLVAAGCIHLSDSVEHRFRPAAAVAAGGALATAAATRPLYWLTAVLACAALLLAARERRLRPAVLVCGLPAVLLAGWLARQSVLSGYPFLPSTVGALPVDWRVPIAIVHEQNRWNDSWARWPGKTPAEVLGSWHWLSPWIHARAKDLDAMAPLAALAVVVPLLAAGTEIRRRFTPPMLAVVIPSLAVLVPWFFIAPDPRFAYAPLWLVPLALLAWALPGDLERPPWWVLAVAGAAALGLAAVGVHDLGWLVLAAFDVWLVAVLGARLVGRRSFARLAALAAVVSVVLAPVGIVAHDGGFDLVHAGGDGPLGTPPLPVASVVPFTTASGLQLFQPAGGDQCWGATLCAPQPGRLVRLRGDGIRNGFATGTSGPSR